MLKNDMRKYILQDKTFEEFLEDYGEKYKNEFSVEIMQRCWKNTHDLKDPVEWHKYLKNKAAAYVKYLTLINEAMEDEGIVLNETRAGYMLKDLIRRQIYGNRTTG